jgi:hypothetical protein
MGHRSDVLRAHGFDAQYLQRLKYRGSGLITLCIAEKQGKEFYAFRPEPAHFAEGHFRRLMDVQEAIPHMVRISEIIADVVLFEKAPGKLLWETESLPEDVTSIISQLEEFADATKAHGLINGDLRPWNVFLDEHMRVHVIDWDLSSFVDDLHPDQHLVKGHYRRFHGDVSLPALAEIDPRDAERTGQLLTGKIGYAEAWGSSHPSWLPPWCRR